MRVIQPTILALIALAFAGCASVPPGTPNDPFERTNRDIYAFNNTFNKYVTLPAAWVYVTYVPVKVRVGIHNVLSNLGEPITFANDVLQGNVGCAGQSLLRFALNSTIGIGGMVDVAANNGVPRHESDFGRTLFVYGIGPGPYLIVPVIGPTTPRDFFGTLVDLAADPLMYVPPSWTFGQHVALTAGVRFVDPFEINARNLVLRQNFSKGSTDPYVTMRSMYYQQREQELGIDEYGED